MITVNVYQKEEICEDKLKFSVIAARKQRKWIFCRHKKRSTWEIPGGHIEAGESACEAAKRELYEETGAEEYELKEVCVYEVNTDAEITYGMLYFAEVSALGQIPAESEIGAAGLFEYIPKELTYPEIQPYLFDWVQQWLNLQS